jgi:hypothetical protein
MVITFCHPHGQDKSHLSNGVILFQNEVIPFQNGVIPFQMESSLFKMTYQWPPLGFNSSHPSSFKTESKMEQSETLLSHLFPSVYEDITMYI